MRDPKKGEQCGAFLRNRQQDVAGNERRRRGKQSQEGGAWNGESYPRYIKVFPRQRKRYFYSSGPVIVEYLSRHSAMERRMAKTANQRRPFSKPAKKS